MLRTSRDGPVVTWTVDRPATRNALDSATMAAMNDAIVAAQQDPTVRAAVLTGAGGTFVSGGDLVELREKSSASDAAVLSDAGEALCVLLESCQFPVIAAIAGAALGGGAELALACDLRVAEASAKVGFVQARMGVVTAWGSTARLVATAGIGHAARMLLLGSPVDGTRARELGIVDEIAEPGQALATAVALGKLSAECAPGAVAEAKRLLVAARRSLYESLRPLERDAFVRTWSGREHGDAVLAYFRKTKPPWQG